MSPTCRPWSGACGICRRRRRRQATPRAGGRDVLVCDTCDQPTPTTEERR